MTTYPKTFFETGVAEEPGFCFVIMPFERKFRPTYSAIKVALEAPRVGFVCRRADEMFGSHQIMQDILTGIAEAQLVIADLTSRNANVFYELGIAHMTKPADRLILLTQTLRDVPFDLRAYRCIEYRNSTEGRQKLRRQLSETVVRIAGGPYRFTIEPGESHETGPLFEAPDRCLYAVLVSDLITGPRFAKCMVQVSRHVVGQAPRGVLRRRYGSALGEARQLGDLPWALRLDSTRGEDNSASFSIVPYPHSLSARQAAPPRPNKALQPPSRVRSRSESRPRRRAARG